MGCNSSIIAIIVALIEKDNQAYSNPRNYKAPSDQQLQSQRQTIRTTCQQDKPRNLKDFYKGQTKAQQSFNSYSLFARRFDNAKVLVNKLWHSTLTTHTSLKMAKGTCAAINTKLISNKLATTRSKTAKNNLKACDELFSQVENEKKIETKRRRKGQRRRRRKKSA
jgi:hypothetical protein